MLRRRLFALIAVLAVAWGALWPLVSAARPKSAGIPSFICTQSGVQQHPGLPGSAGDDFHCPLCIASADGVVPVVPALHAALELNGVAVTAPRVTAPHHLFSARPPPGRGPPALS